MRNKNVFVIILVLVFAFLAGNLISSNPLKNSTTENHSQHGDLYSRFQKLSTAGNSTCSEFFTDSIKSMRDSDRLQGSCCSAMVWHRYEEQIEGLKKYKDISFIPQDPYDVEAKLAKKLLSYYELDLSAEQQKAYDYAMENSHEKGPCCCKCWRWYVYGGLGKYLIAEKGFTGEQVTEVWNLSDGCGGEGDHVTHG